MATCSHVSPADTKATETQSGVGRRATVLAAALSSWREVTVDRVATKQILAKVVQRIKNVALSKTFDCWALWQQAQLRDREMRRVSAEQEAASRCMKESSNAEEEEGRVWPRMLRSVQRAAAVAAKLPQPSPGTR